MKIYCYDTKHLAGAVKMYNGRMQSLEKDGLHNYLGELDLDIKPEKKVVKKERFLANAIPWGGNILNSDGLSQARIVPLDAKNIHITYEVEE